MKNNETNEQEKKQKELTPDESKKLWDNISAGIDRIEGKRKKRNVGITTAMLVVLMVIGFVGYHRMTSPDIFLAKGSDKELVLEDGTVVQLLAGGKLTVEKSFPDDMRAVHLEGNAVFRVRKSEKHPFIVFGGNGYQAKVLGTVFKVMQEKNAFRVELYKGKVAVSESGQKDKVYELSPDEAFDNYGSKKVAAVTGIREENGKELNSKEDIPLINLEFDDARLDEILSVIEKTYGVRVNYPAEYAATTITMSLNERKEEAVLQALALTTGLTLKKYDTGYRLEK
ncbi:FecR family protein [Chryseobacterium sp. 'Rf worker isolate 10']|uniref:FecR family protein n=1 Tax=Chryseobacterium sp. 'Rf worker isolate 10' TaxID=2887348 RepID=UPI003D6F1F35